MTTTYLTVEDALVIIDRYGYDVRDLGLLLSAIARPTASAFGEDAYATLWLKAAALLESVARNHPLVDGNKRTALRMTAYFLRLNGWRWEFHPTNEEFVIKVASGEVALKTSANYLEAHSNLALRGGPLAAWSEVGC